MEAFEVYTIGNAYFLNKIFNAISIIFASGFTSILKIAVSISLVMLVFRSMMSSNFKDTIRWVIGVILVTSLFLTTKAKVIIHDQLPDTQGRIQAAYIVDEVPWGLAWIAHVTSNVGKVVMEKFEMAFSGVTNNQTYRKHGLLFGSKIVEDANRIRISNPDLRHFMVKFYRQCMVPDLKMGHTRKNGYTFKELATTQDIGTFLKDHASNARSIYLVGQIITKEPKAGGIGDFFNTFHNKQSTTIDGYVSCNKAAHYIYDMIEHEVDQNKHAISSSFISQFMGDKVSDDIKNTFYESVLKDTYGAFLKSSREASDILKQNIMINAVRDSSKSVASIYAQTATEEMTRSSMYSVSQVFQKFIPIIRSVLECIFYGVAPLILILMVTPIGLEVLKNYAFSFVYLQMWPPMYAILYVITESWSRSSSSHLVHNMMSLPQIESINHDISMVSGYMLAMIPMLAMFVTKGLVASVGNMASSMMYIPQTAAVNASDQAVKGNFSMGNMSLDNHSYDNLNAHKHDDNYSWMSGMRAFQQHTGSIMRETPDGNRMLDMSGSTHNLGGLANITRNNAVGTRLDESETMAQKEVESASKDYVTSASSGMSKMLGYDSSYSKGTSAYEAINKSMTSEERQSADYVRSVTDKISHANNVSSSDVLKMALSAKGGFNMLGGGASAEISKEHTSQDIQAWNQVQDAMKDERFSQSLSKVESIGKTNNIQTNESESESLVNSMRSDFNESQSASSRVSSAKENLHSIQEARSNYENNSDSIDVNLNNKFADWGINKYGAERFEHMLKNEPASLRKESQDFLREEVGDIGKYKFTALADKDLNLSKTDYSNIKSKHDQNNETINKETNEFVDRSEYGKVNLKANYKDSDAKFEKDSSHKTEQLSDHKSSILQKTDERENNVRNKKRLK